MTLLILAKSVEMSIISLNRNTEVMQRIQPILIVFEAAIDFQLKQDWS
jgi:hypothetical protein